MKNNYVPFLKFKVNEVGAISELDDDIKDELTPFFDVPRRDGLTYQDFEDQVSALRKKAEKYLGAVQYFFVDTFDIPDDLCAPGDSPYSLVCKEFGGLAFVPVVGIDRSVDHNNSVFSIKAAGGIISDLVAVRVRPEDFQSFKTIRAELEELLDQCNGVFADCILILDAGFCLTLDVEQIGIHVVKFVEQSLPLYKFSRVIFAGSSIPASIGEVAGVQTAIQLERAELKAFAIIHAAIGSVVELGDYTIVSPLYSDVDLAPEILLNVTAPKVIYSFEQQHTIYRGGAIRTHPRGATQYNDISADIVAKSYFRGADYSFGDKFLYDKSHGRGKSVTPSSILKPTINAHITFMSRDFSL